jgi:hypothetical protein
MLVFSTHRFCDDVVSFTDFTVVSDVGVADDSVIVAFVFLVAVDLAFSIKIVFVVVVVYIVFVVANYAVDDVAFDVEIVVLNLLARLLLMSLTLYC